MYKATYSGSLGDGYGLAVLANGKVYGGNSAIYYTGTYTVHPNGVVQARLKAERLWGSPTRDVLALCPREKYRELDGDVNADGTITLEARSKQMPGVALRIRLEFLAP